MNLLDKVVENGVKSDVTLKRNYLNQRMKLSNISSKRSSNVSTAYHIIIECFTNLGGTAFVGGVNSVEFTLNNNWRKYIVQIFT